ncbi:hypothetical protein ACHAPU_004575 [Fusarium lateritium]
MGTLKRTSGATPSVLEPLHPPSRQQVYHEVARPGALINIARASDETKSLALLVRRYVDEEFNLKTSVPSLGISAQKSSPNKWTEAYVQMINPRAELPGDTEDDKNTEYARSPDKLIEGLPSKYHSA